MVDGLRLNNEQTHRKERNSSESELIHSFASPLSLSLPMGDTPSSVIIPIAFLIMVKR